jgi:sugar (pentulose or hexulose) kinase
MDWSEVADKLGIRHLLPSGLKNPWDVLGTLKPEVAKAAGLDEEVIVTVGIHDSNASMLPYLVTLEDDFLLNSTGTWCVIMHEKDRVAFAPEELGKVVFYNMNAFFKPIKTAIFLGGLEFEYYMNLLKKIHGDVAFPGFDRKRVQKVITDNDKFILPSVTKGIGQFPESSPRIIEGGRTYPLEDVESGRVVPEFFRDFETACAVLNLSMAVQTKVAFDRADMTPGLQVFTEGGFTKNDGYNALMASFYPDSGFYLTNLKEATAYGAALVGKAAMEQIPLRDMRDLVYIEKNRVPPAGLEGIERYLEQFLELL